MALNLSGYGIVFLQTVFYIAGHYDADNPSLAD